jgi:outer membrane protein assembly factor BamB
MRNANLATRVVVGGVLLLSGTWARAQDWPQWRGPNRDAKVTGFTAPETWPKQLTQKWKVPVGNGVATPALVGDKVYVFARQGGDEVLRCLDAASGKELWLDKYAAQPATGASAQFPGPRCSPTVADGKVVTLGVQGTLSCYDAASGKLLWRKDDVKGHPQFFTSSSPIIADGLCIAQLGGPKQGAIVAYDLATGEQKWTAPTDGPAYASPELMNVGGTKLIVAMTDSKVLAVTESDGKQVWQTPFERQGMSYNAATPIVDGQTVIYTGTNRGIKAVQLDKGGEGVTAKELWSNKEKSVQFNTPVLKDGFLYGITANNEFYCINAQSGRTAWSATPLGAASPMGGGGGGRGRGGMRGGGGLRPGYGSIVDAGSVLLALTPHSQLIAFRPNDKAYTEVARIKVADTPTYAYPIIAGNRVFVKDQESLALLAIE